MLASTDDDVADRETEMPSESKMPPLPSEASLSLPVVHNFVEYVVDDGKATQSMFTNPSSGKLRRKTQQNHHHHGAAFVPPIKVGPDLVPCRGDYFSAEVKVGELEHCLTTNILTHMVLAQKVFMRDVNDVVQKLSGGDRPVPVWNELGEMVELHWRSYRTRRLLFSVVITIKNITITAVTPANSALRFETGMSVVNISNRLRQSDSSDSGSEGTNADDATRDRRMRISTNARINLKFSLGQLVRDSIYSEAEPQFLSSAYFKTTVYLINAYHGQAMDSSFNLPLTQGSDFVVHHARPSSTIYSADRG